MDYQGVFLYRLISFHVDKHNGSFVYSTREQTLTLRAGDLVETRRNGSAQFGTAHFGTVRSLPARVPPGDCTFTWQTGSPDHISYINNVTSCVPLTKPRKKHKQKAAALLYSEAV